MQAAKPRPVQRRTSAAAIKDQMLDFLAEALPDGWIAQRLAGPAPAGAGGIRADILVISPRGRCHFLFVRAPADRWWDGGPRCVPAERFPSEGVCLARNLRAAGHKARAVWDAQDLARALKSWGCPLSRPVRLAAPPRATEWVRSKPDRPVLHLTGWGRRDYA